MENRHRKEPANEHEHGAASGLDCGLLVTWLEDEMPILIQEARRRWKIAHGHEPPVNHYHPHTPHSTNGAAGRYFDENGFMYAEIGE